MSLNLLFNMIIIVLTIEYLLIKFNCYSWTTYITNSFAFALSIRIIEFIAINRINVFQWNFHNILKIWKL